MLYKIKTITIYEVELDSPEEAIRYYNEGLWDHNDMTDDDAFELGYVDETNEYHVLKED